MYTATPNDNPLTFSNDHKYKYKPEAGISVIDGEKRFNEDTWVVSIVNTTKKLFLGGHAAIVVEGIDENHEMFLGQYEIFSGAEEEQSGVNEKGVIVNIECRGTHENRECNIRLLNNEVSEDIQKKVKEGKEIAIIRNENDGRFTIIYKKRDNNEVASLIIEDSKKELLEALSTLFFDGTILDRSRNEIAEKTYRLVYDTVILNGGYVQYKNNKTRDYNTDKFPSESYSISREAALRMIASIKEDESRTVIARQNVNKVGNNKVKDADGNPIEYLRYQRLGKNHPWVAIFGDPIDGDNCMGWCLEKTAVAGIDGGNRLPKPPKPSCAIL